MHNTLEGVRVLDFTQVLAGPYCTQQLALLGAEVIKVENRVGGDQARQTLPATDPDLEELGASPLFLAVNTGKRSLTLDLKHERAGEVVRRLAAGSDVLVENFKAGTMDRLGFGYGAMSAINPKLIYCAISGYGQTGPRASAAAYDAAIQAASGMMSVTGTPETGPVKTGHWTIDMTTATQACFAISASLFCRERTGQGDFLDLSMLDTAAGVMAPNLTMYSVNGTVPNLSGNRSQTGNPVADVYPASDGLVMIAAATQNQFLSLASLLGREELTADARFLTLSDRIANADELRVILSDAFSRESAAIWEDRLADAGIPAARVSTIPQVWQENPQLTHRGVFQTVPRQPGAGEGDWPYVDVAFHGMRKVARTPHPAPLLGEHTEEILAEAGFSPTEIGELRSQNVV
ncbi:MAG: CoA transferase [Rhodospirillales bacterium]|nr:CoA transferase [Rhodospirillales bacterium]